MVANIHSKKGVEKRDIVTTFFCDIVEANRACRYHTVPSPKRQSPSNALIYHRLNVQAYLWGWWDPNRGVGDGGESHHRKTGRFAMMSKTRRQYEQVWKHSSVTDLWHDSTDSSRVLNCPSRSLLEDLLERSLVMEKQLRLQDAEQIKMMGIVENESEHRELFWNSTQRYCSVNAAGVLQSSQHNWKSYYQSI